MVHKMSNMKEDSDTASVTWTVFSHSSDSAIDRHFLSSFFSTHSPLPAWVSPPPS
jgi:hypothetical protein